MCFVFVCLFVSHSLVLRVIGFRSAGLENSDKYFFCLFVYLFVSYSFVLRMASSREFVQKNIVVVVSYNFPLFVFPIYIFFSATGQILRITANLFFITYTFPPRATTLRPTGQPHAHLDGKPECSTAIVVFGRPTNLLNFRFPLNRGPLP